jgi:hypothetical protein
MKAKFFVALALAALLPGCLERKEKTTVHADGSVHVALHFKGDAGEFAADAAEKLPSGAPWTVRDEDVGRDHVRTAEADFRSASEVPETSGSPDDAAPLHAKTSVTVERTKDGGTRWIFERRYAARPRAWRQRLFDRAFPESLKKELERKEGDPPLSDEQLLRAVTALVQFERERNASLLEQTLTAIGEKDALVSTRARASFLASFDATWKPEDVLVAVKGSPEEHAKLDARYKEATGKSAVKSAADAVIERSPEANRAELESKLAAAFETARRIHDATEALQLHTFEVKVELPGKIVATDAPELEDDGHTAVFKFGGADLCDREHVLRAVAESAP